MIVCHVPETTFWFVKSRDFKTNQVDTGSAFGDDRANRDR